MFRTNCKIRILALGIACLLQPLCAASILDNGDFSDGNDQKVWKFWVNQMGSSAKAYITFEREQAEILIKNGGTDIYNIRFWQEGIKLEPGTQYTLTFKACTGAGNYKLTTRVRDARSSKDSWAVQTTRVSRWPKKYSLTFTPTEGKNVGRVEFDLGGSSGIGGNVVIDDVEISKT